jgi:hypothetical protein
VIIKASLYSEIETNSKFTPLDEIDPTPAPLHFTVSPFGNAPGDSSSALRVIFTFKNWYDVHVTLRSMFTIRSDEQDSTQLPELWIDPDLLQPSNFCNRCGDIEYTSFTIKCKKDTIKFCGFCGFPQHKVFNCSY